MELNHQQYYGTADQARRNLGSAFSLSDLPALVDDPGIHFIRAAHTTEGADFPVDSVMDDQWKPCTGTDAQYLGYLPQLFAQRLRADEPHVPIGISQTAWGGTPIRDHVPGGRIYKNHIAPLRGMRIAGVIWYQGCNDRTGRARTSAPRSHSATCPRLWTTRASTSSARRTPPRAPILRSTV